MFCLEQGSVQTLRGALRRSLRRCRLQLQSLSGSIRYRQFHSKPAYRLQAALKGGGRRDGRESEEAEA